MAPRGTIPTTSSRATSAAAASVSRTAGGSSRLTTSKTRRVKREERTPTESSSEDGESGRTITRKRIATDVMHDDHDHELSSATSSSEHDQQQPRTRTVNNTTVGRARRVANAKGKARVKKEAVSEEEYEDDDGMALPPSSRQSATATATAIKSRSGSSRTAASATTMKNAGRARARPTTAAKARRVIQDDEEEENNEDVGVERQKHTRPARRESAISAEDSFEDSQEEEDVKPARAGPEKPAAVTTAIKPASRPTRAESERRERGDSVSSSSSSRASSPAPSTPAAQDDQEMPSRAKELIIANSADDGAATTSDKENVNDTLLTGLPPTKRLAPILAPVETGPRKRLVIHKLVLVNFKSYAGRQVIGPFHKSFSSIVGPNGSGKSNTIDAMLFVFGFKATKMRQTKLSELIHNSEGMEELDFCSVEVWFREIIDLPGPDDYEVVPGSTLVITREAYRNNQSKYTMDGKTSSYKEVQTLLKGRGIDLDHKRFLILQGEVESISQMKPKAPNEHEDGLLEYLEDIVGTTRFKEPIEECIKQVDELNEERLEKTNRVKLVEREKSALESAKKEADGFLTDQNQLVHRQSELYQVYQMRYRENIAVASQSAEQATNKLDKERDSQAGIRADVESIQKEYDGLKENVTTLEKHTAEISKEQAAFEKKDVQLQEKKKHLVTKQKKLTKSLQDDGHAKNEATSWFKNYGEDMTRLKAELEKHEVNLAREEAELEKICEGLKDKTAGFTQQIEVKQNELQPWLDKVSQKQASIDIAKNEVNLLREKSESLKRAVVEAEEALEKVQTDNAEKEDALRELIGEKATIEKAISELQAETDKLQAHDQKLKAAASAARQRADDARASQAASRSRGDVLTSLTKLKEQGRLGGFHGRLGNLGRIDDKFDVAISTACPSLDNLVCDTVEAGQACLEHLRRNNLGRATILCLAALNKKGMDPIQTPEGVPRLFDLVTPKDAKFAPAFYQVLRDTLVAENLTQANRIAFGGAKRWRVVTLDGKLIDTSGTMSGGGNRVARGGMSSKFSSDEDTTPEVIARLEQETAKADNAVQLFTTERREKEAELVGLGKKIEEIELQISKTEMAVRGGKKRVEEAQKRILELRGQNKQPQGEDVKRIQALDGEIKKLTDDLWKLEEKRDRIQGEIKVLQDKILEVGGVRLRSQQVKVEGIKEMSDHTNDQLTKAEVGRAKAERDMVKLDKAIKVNTIALEEIEEELAALEKNIRGNAAGLEHIRTQLDQAKDVLDERSLDLAEIKKILDEKLAHMNKFRARETELEQELEKARRTLSENEKSLASVKGRLEKLELHDIEDDDDDDDEGEEQAEKPAEELKIFSEEELNEFDQEGLKATIALLEERIQQAKPNLAVLKEYKRREREFLERAQELERVTAARDAAKQRHDELRQQRLDEFMTGFRIISMKLKEMYQLITLGGNAELELVDTLDPFSEGIVFSVMPPKKSWRPIINLSGGEKTLASLALTFGMHAFRPTPIYFFDEVDSALDFRNVSIIANYIKDCAEDAQFITISLRSQAFELANRLVGVYKVNGKTRSLAIDNADLDAPPPEQMMVTSKA